MLRVLESNFTHFVQVLVFLLVFWSPKQVNIEESYEESWAKLRSHLPRVNPDCKEKKQRGSAMEHTLDDSHSSHFWGTSWSPNNACYIPFQSSGSQQSNASNGSQIGVEMKKLEPLEADHTKLKANFAGCEITRWWPGNQPLAAKWRPSTCKIS